jgi:lipopolysaccharide transport system ATP-binding protein
VIHTAFPVTVENVWKKFRRGERQDSLRDIIPSLASRIVRRSPAIVGPQEFWALREVTFSVARGEAVGIIGPNGAGKSTLLKLLNRILRPTVGKVRVSGKVAALIEVAAGFHPDLTGRENIFLQGAIMGMTRHEMLGKVDRIIEFAGVEQFIDTPVKRYSSGMNARLGFSIAAHMEPDVLLIDEVLAVGDMAFQEKCIARMKEFKANGVAIVFISHNMQAVSSLCDAAIHLQSTVRHHGSVVDSISSYLQSSQAGNVDPTHGEVSITSVSLAGARRDGYVCARPGDTLRLSVSYQVHSTISELQFGVALFRSTDGLVVYDRGFAGSELGLSRVEAGRIITVDYVLDANLTRGQYHFDCHVRHDPTSRYVSRSTFAAHVRIDESETWAGIADLNIRAAVRTSGVNPVRAIARVAR